MSPVLLLAGAIAVLGLIWLLDTVIRSQRTGLYLIVGLNVVDLAVSLPRADVGGTTVTVNDVVFVVVMAALLARVLRGWSPSTLQLGIILLLCIIIFSIARGTLVFGLASSVNEARSTLYFVSVILYASFLSPDDGTRTEAARLWFAYALGLVGVTVLRWAIVLGGLPGRGNWFDPGYGGLRVIYSDETLAISAAFLIVFPRIIRGEATRREWQLGAVFGGTVLVLQHRSVIAVLLAGAAVLLWYHRHLLSRQVVYGGCLAAMAVGVALVTLLDGGQLASQASQADAANTVTFEWRIQGWQVLLRDSGPTGPEEAALGKPYGSGYERRLPTGERVDVAPHNMYLELLLRVGLAGLGVYVGIGLIAWNRLRRHRPTMGSGYLDDSTLAAILVAFALYMVPYNLFTQTGVLVGLAISAAVRDRGRDGPPEQGPVEVARTMDPPRVEGRWVRGE